MRFLSLLTCAATTLVTAATAQDRVTVYQGATILPAGAAAIANGVLVVHNGKIQTIGGASTPLPANADVIDCKGKTITPGLVDASFRGSSDIADLNEQSDEVTPHLRVLDCLDPEDPLFLRARRAGTTSVHVMPGTRNVIAGLGCAVKTFGSDPAKMVLARDTSLRIVMGSEPSLGNRAIRGGRVDSIYYRRPTTRMGVVWEARKAFYDAKEEMTLGAGPATSDPGREILKQVLQGTMTAYTTARSEQDIRTALRLAAEFGYQTVIDDAQDAHYLIGELSEAKVTVLLGAPSATAVGGTAARDGADPRGATATLLANNNIPFVITTGSNAQALDLVREAMFAARNGLAADRAIDAVTILPAKLLGIDARVGSLAAGKDADFVVWSHHPLDPAAMAESVCIDGLEVSSQ